MGIGILLLGLVIYYFDKPVIKEALLDVNQNSV